jgi:hypothetical protein
MSTNNEIENNIINNNNENDNLIKQFSRNFAKNFQALKLSNKPIKNNPESPPKKIKKKNVNEQTKLSNKSLLNSLFDFNFFNTSPQKETQKYPNQTTITNQNQKETSKINNSGKKNSPKSKNNIIFSSYKANQTTSVQSTKILNEKNNKAINIKSKLIDRSKSRDKNSLLDKKNTDPFLARINKYQEEKKNNIYNLKKKYSEKELKENSRHPKISKNSLLLIEKKYDKKALFQPRQMKEKNIVKNFDDFYTRTLKESYSCSSFRNSVKFSFDKFYKFYDIKMQWLKGIEDKIQDEKKENQQNEEKSLSKLTFKPSLNKRSLKMMNKKIKEKENSIKDKKDINIHSNQVNNINEKIGKENITKYKIKLKNIISDFYNKNPNYTLNKNKKLMKRSKTQINISTRYNLLKKNNKNKSISKSKCKKKLYKFKNKEQRKTENKKDINNDFNNINKYTYILKKKEKIKKKRLKKMKEIDIYSFYKINVNTGCAWMNQTLNQINYDKKYKNLIKKSIL